MKKMQEDDLDLWDDEVEKGIDFSKITRKILSYWPVSVLCMLIMVGLAWMYLYRTNSVYKVNASVLIKDDDKKSGTNNNVLSSLQDIGLIGGASNVNNEQIIITSYPLLENVVKDLQLYMQFYVKEKFRTIPLYKDKLPFSVEVVDYKWADSLNKPTGSPVYQIVWKDAYGFTVSKDSAEWKGNWNVPISLPFGRLTLRSDPQTEDRYMAGEIFMQLNPVNLVAEQLSAGITADIPNKQTSIINLSLNTPVPHRGVDILNALMATYQSTTVNDNNRLNDSTLKFINQRLKVVGLELDSIEFAVQHFKQANQLADLGAQTNALIDNLSKGSQDQNEQQVQLSVVNSLIEFMRENRDNSRVIPTSLIVNNVALSNAIDNFNQLLIQRERLKLSATDENPILKNTDEQIASLHQRIFSGLESIRNSLTTGIEKIAQQNAAITGAMHRVPGIERVFESISRQRSIKQELYLYLLQKREEALIAKSSTLANSRIIAPARASISPVKPKRRLVMIGAALIGLLIPFMFDRAYSLFNTRIRSREEVLSRTAIPIIGEIGHQDQGGQLNYKGTYNSLVAEQFRALRTNIQFLIRDTEKRVLLLTSTVGGEGKTFISSNLASILALTGKKILLLEMDLRKPKLTKKLGLSAKVGFSQYVLGKAGIEDIIVPSGIHENVFVIPAGAIPPNPSELLQHKKTVELFDYLRTRFDVLLVDTPPAIVSDAQLLAKSADITLFIVRLNYSHKDQFETINALAQKNVFPDIHLVINDIKTNRFGGNYYGYGKKYEYGYYYEGEEKENWWWPFRRKENIQKE